MSRHVYSIELDHRGTWQLKDVTAGQIISCGGRGPVLCAGHAIARKTSPAELHIQDLTGYPGLVMIYEPSRPQPAPDLYDMT